MADCGGLKLLLVGCGGFVDRVWVPEVVLLCGVELDYAFERGGYVKSSPRSDLCMCERFRLSTCLVDYQCILVSIVYRDSVSGIAG